MVWLFALQWCYSIIPTIIHPNSQPWQRFTEGTDAQRKQLNSGDHEGEMYCNYRGQAFSKLTFITGHVQRTLFTAAGNFMSLRGNCLKPSVHELLFILSWTTSLWVKIEHRVSLPVNWFFYQLKPTVWSRSPDEIEFSTMVRWCPLSSYKGQR